MSLKQQPKRHLRLSYCVQLLRCVYVLAHTHTLSAFMVFSVDTGSHDISCSPQISHMIWWKRHLRLFCRPDSNLNTNAQTVSEAARMSRDVNAVVKVCPPRWIHGYRICITFTSLVFRGCRVTKIQFSTIESDHSHEVTLSESNLKKPSLVGV